DRNISWGFIFPDLRVNLKPESFRHPPLSYPSSTKYTVYLYSESCFGLLSAKLIIALKTKSPAAITDRGRKCKAGALPS
ncbi:hypothetical protein, partial [Escherichia coli]|uniref:hypothetical protein n=1 Tax=Escherichia coli TaxID=562 RepID=UPI001B8C4298